MFSVSQLYFFQPLQPVTPAAEQKNYWMDLALTSFEECLKNNELLAAVLIDGLFVQYHERLLTPQDIQTHSLDMILSSCIDALEKPYETHPFQFRQCNINRIIAYFNQLNLNPDFKATISPEERYKISLAIYHTLITSPHGIIYDQMMVDSDLEQIENIRLDKRQFESHILERIKLNLLIVDNDYILVNL